ncbi:MAG: hypothetical protein ACXVA9_02735 [Bdellovibrionales bacterium]
MNKVISITLAALTLASISAFGATAKENLFKLEGAMSAKNVPSIVRDEILASKKVIQAVENTDIEISNVTKVTVDMNHANYTITFSTVEPGLGPKGPSTHPCTNVISANTTSGMTLSVEKVDVEQICAQNLPRFK